MLTLSNQVLPFPSTQSTFFWTRFCRPYGSMMHTSNYTLEAQTKLLTYFYARFNGIMGAEEKPETLSLMTIDGSPCEVSWASRCLQRLSSRAHSENHASISRSSQPALSPSPGRSIDRSDSPFSPRRCWLLTTTAHHLLSDTSVIPALVSTSVGPRSSTGWPPPTEASGLSS